MRVCNYLLYFSIFLFSCRDNKQQLFQLMKDTGIDFQNKLVDGKIENGFTFRNFYNGGGVALGDINNDGLADIFLTANMESNKLYLNKGDFKFDDITMKAGFRQDDQWCTGVVFADVNSDGWLDIFVCSSGNMSDGNRRNKLYINQKNLTFKEEAEKFGLNIKGYTTQVSFFDYDNDHDLDCFMINNSPIPINTLNNANRRDLPDAKWPIADFLKGGGDHLFRNDNGHFKEVTKEAGIHGSLISFGLGVSVGDLNTDGYPDVYVSNDSYERDYLYINQKNGTFIDQLEERMAHTSFSSMGADIADINNDGYPEVFTTDMLPDDDFRLKTTGAFDNIDLFRNKVKSGFYYQYMKNCLQLNNKEGVFSDIANYSGVSATDWSWGALMFDADNDGFNDIYVCNGVNRDVTNLDFMDFFANEVIQKMVTTGKKEAVDDVLKKIPKTPLTNKMYKNLGNLKFTDAAQEWGLSDESFSNGAAYGDLDNDGDLDLVVNNINQQAFIYRNNARQLTGNHYVSIMLKGNNKNRFAIGSNIKVYAGNEVIMREIVPSRGFQSSVDYKTVFGLGKFDQVDSIVITWPDHTNSILLKPAVDSSYLVLQETAVKIKRQENNGTLSPPLLEEVENIFEKHVEDDHVDFYYERNIPQLLSREGPKATSADANGDGRADIYIGGTSLQPGQLYLQQANGFLKKDNKVFKEFSDFEDGAVHFFDADEDGDQDLYVGAAGNNMGAKSRQSQHRLYKNDGKGNFTIDNNAFPENDMNIGVACDNDFDQDGDLDLFVGGRSIPGNFGFSPTSYLYQNDGQGHFTDVTQIMNPEIVSIGMVTAATWADMTGDKNKELVITGEWMATRIFQFNNNRFTELKTNLQSLSGMWRSIVATDLNGDGKPDLVMGNIGENFYLRPTADEPVKLWLNDFDNNGTQDKVLSRSINGKDMPVFLKHEMDDQIPALKKESLLHETFAKKTVQELFKNEVIKKSIIKSFNYAASCIAINNGNGNFTIMPLPYMVQLSSVNAMLCTDVNYDGHPDLIIGGNDSGFQPQFGRLDASFGVLLLNDGLAQFTQMNPEQSGFFVTGEVRDILEIANNKSRNIVVLRNNDKPALFRINPSKLK